MRVERYCDHFFERNVADNEWLLHAAERRWVALSHDDNIRRDREALRIVMESSGRLFIVRGACTTAELAKTFLEARRAIERILAAHDVFVALIRRTAKHGGAFHATAEVWMRYEDWRRKPGR